MSKYVYIIYLLKVNKKNTRDSDLKIIGIYDSENTAKEEMYVNETIVNRNAKHDEFYTWIGPYIEEVKMNNTNTFDKHYKW